MHNFTVLKINNTNFTLASEKFIKNIKNKPEEQSITLKLYKHLLFKFFFNLKLFYLLFPNKNH